MTKLLILVQWMLIISVAGFSQARTITGQVKDENGNPAGTRAVIKISFKEAVEETIN